MLIAVLLVAGVVSFILFSKVKINIKFYDKGLGFSIKINEIKVYSYPKPRKSNKDLARKKSHKARHTKISDTTSLIVRLLKKIKKFAGDLTKNLVVESLKVSAVISNENPATAAIEYGALSTTVGLALPIVESNFIVKDKRINILLDFSQQKSSVDIDLILSIKLRHLVKALINFMLGYVDVLNKLKKKNYQSEAC